MDIFLHWIKHVIKTYGYLGVFGSQMLGMFGLPVPDETILTFTGFLIFKGIMHPLPAFLAAYLGSIGGITLNYLVGRYIGCPLLHKYGAYLHLNDERIDQAHRWFEQLRQICLVFRLFLPRRAPPDRLYRRRLPPGVPAVSPPTLTAAAFAGWPPSWPWVISWGRSGTRSFPRSSLTCGWWWGW